MFLSFLQRLFKLCFKMPQLLIKLCFKVLILKVLIFYLNITVIVMSLILKIIEEESVNRRSAPSKLDNDEFSSSTVGQNRKLTRIEVKRDNRKIHMDCKNNSNIGQKSTERQNNGNQRKAANCISDTFLLNFDTMLLICCPKKIVSPDFIVSVFGKIDQSLNIRIKWRERPSLLSNVDFDYIIAKFSERNLALVAAKKMWTLSRCVLTIPMEKFLYFIIDAETRHPTCGERSTRIFISRRWCFTSDDSREHAANFLSTFGDITEIRFCDETEQEDLGFVCEVTYQYACQAYAAMLYLDGFRSYPIGLCTVVVEESQYVAEVLQTVKGSMIEQLDESGR